MCSHVFQMEVLLKTGQPMKAVEVVIKGTTRCPSSVLLWKQHLLVALQLNGDLENVKNIIDQACRQIKAKV